MPTAPLVEQVEDPAERERIAITLSNVREELPSGSAVRENVDSILELIDVLHVDPANAVSPATIETAIRDVLPELPQEAQGRVRDLLNDEGNTTVQLSESRERDDKVGTFMPVRVTEALRTSSKGNRGGRTYRVAVIEAGTSANGRMYPPDTLEEATPKFENTSVHAFRFSSDDLNHLPQDKKNQVPEGAVGNKVGQLENCNYERSKERIECDMFVPDKPSYQWFIDLVETALESGKQMFGFSIDGNGESFPKRVRNRVVEFVNRIDQIDSLDAVSEPAAGGMPLAKKLTEACVGDPYHRLRFLEHQYRRAEGTFVSPIPSQTGESTLGATTDRDVEGGMEPMNTAQTLNALMESLGPESDPEAGSVVTTLRRAQRVDRSGNHDVSIDIDKLRGRLESIPTPSSRVEEALKALNRFEESFTVKEQGDTSSDAPDSSSGSGDNSGEGPSEEPKTEEERVEELVDDLIEALKDEEDDPARQVHQTLTEAKKLSEEGQTVELDLEDIHKKLKSVEDPSDNVEKAVEMIKDELDKQEEDGESSSSSGSSSSSDSSGDSGDDNVSEGGSMRESIRRRRPSSRLPEAGSMASVPPELQSQIDQMQRELRETKSELNQVREKNNDLQRELEQTEHDLALSEWQALLEQRVGNSNLPKGAADKVRSELYHTPLQGGDSALKERIQEELNYVNSIRESERPRYDTPMTPADFNLDRGNQPSALEEIFGVS